MNVNQKNYIESVRFNATFWTQNGQINSLTPEIVAAVTYKQHFEMLFIQRIGKQLPGYKHSFFCSAVLTPLPHHW